jgi:L-cysteine:1D-myo-inositol 2-amino-2-deoxy-alpha-D-glucopyranoside ligase
MVAYQGEKMSKSLGNLVLVSQLRESGVDARIIRLALLAHHYRTDWEWFDDATEEAGTRLASWTAVLAGPRTESLDPELALEEHAVVERMRAALRNDLDTPGALRALDQWVATRPSAVSDLVPNASEALLGIRI